MIALTKTKEPDVLVANFAKWTKVLTDRVAKKEKPTDSEKNKYRHDDIKNALLIETNGKCAYCESKVRHITYGDIEHVVPKNSDLALSFVWENLTLACDVCNTNKGTEVTTSTNFVDPYDGDPEERFNFLGPVIWPRAGDDAARLAEVLLDLNRRDLIDRRLERMEGLRQAIDEATKETNLVLKAALVKRLQTSEVADEKEFAAQARAIVATELPRAGLVP